MFQPRPIDNVVVKTQEYTATTTLSVQQKAKENNILQAIEQYKAQKSNLTNKLGQKAYELYCSNELNHDEFIRLL